MYFLWCPLFGASFSREAKGEVVKVSMCSFLCLFVCLLFQFYLLIRRVLGSDKMADRSDLKACVQYNLARVLVERFVMKLLLWSCDTHVITLQIITGGILTHVKRRLKFTPIKSILGIM